jgi:hypothetical protein
MQFQYVESRTCVREGCETDILVGYPKSGDPVELVGLTAKSLEGKSYEEAQAIVEGSETKAWVPTGRCCGDHQVIDVWTRRL